MILAFALYVGLHSAPQPYVMVWPPSPTFATQQDCENYKQTLDPYMQTRLVCQAQ